MRWKIHSKALLRKVYRLRVHLILRGLMKVMKKKCLVSYSYHSSNRVSKSNAQAATLPQFSLDAR